MKPQIWGSIFFCVAAMAACASSVDNSCSRYCTSELECGRIGRDEVAQCRQSCAERLAASEQPCADAFHTYATCYDDSTTCAAGDCFERFRSFADRCEWHVDEVSLSSATARVQQKPVSSGG